MIFKKKQTCKLCGVKTTDTERCPKCGYSFRTIDQLDTQRAEIERRMRDVKYGIDNLSASYIKLEDIDAKIITIHHP